LPQKPESSIVKSVVPVVLIEEKLSEIIGSGSFALKPDTHYSLTLTFEVGHTEPLRVYLAQFLISEL
jgi:hypothetical protein